MSNLEKAEAEAKRLMELGVVTDLELQSEHETKQQRAEREAMEEAERIYEEEQQKMNKK